MILRPVGVVGYHVRLTRERSTVRLCHRTAEDLCLETDEVRFCNRRRKGLVARSKGTDRPVAIDRPMGEKTPFFFRCFVPFRSRRVVDATSTRPSDEATCACFATQKGGSVKRGKTAIDARGAQELDRNDRKRPSAEPWDEDGRPTGERCR